MYSFSFFLINVYFLKDSFIAYKFLLVDILIIQFEEIILKNSANMYTVATQGVIFVKVFFPICKKTNTCRGKERSEYTW